MSDAEKVANELMSLFLQKGNFAFAALGHGAGGKGFAPARADGEIDSFFDDRGFHGLSVQSVGYSNGDRPRVVVYLTKGRSRDIEMEVQNKKLLVSLRRIGKMIINPEQASSSTNQGKFFLHRNRIACGSSCAPTSETYSGTFGALVHKKGTPKDNMFILSNNHVLAACNHVPSGMPIMSPSSADGGKLLIAPREIGRHAEICTLQSGDPTFVNPCMEDLAIANVTDLARVTSWQGPLASEGGYDTPSKIADIDFDMKVKKIGRTTGLTKGTVEVKLKPFPLPYKAKHFTATVWFQDAWSIRGTGGDFALPGDSGSLVVRDDGEEAAVGMIFATSPYGETAVIPMKHIAVCFGGLMLVGSHGV
jgi:hypothetical protein